MSPFAGGSHICPQDNTSSSYSPSLPDNLLTNSVKRSLAGQEMEMSAPNVRRLMNTFRPSSDLDALFKQGYDLTHAYINDTAKISRHISCIPSPATENGALPTTCLETRSENGGANQ